jgi:hypothetical protein
VIFRRRFSDVIRRQLDGFSEDHAALLERITEARAAYAGAPREEAEDRFGEYQAWLADGTEALVRLRDNYSSTLDETTAREYEDAFNRAVRRRFGDLAFELEDD